MEISKIARIRDLQKQAVALVGTAIVAAFVSTGNVLGQLYLGVLQSDGVLAAIILGSAVAGVLFVCIVLAVCRQRMRR